MKLTSMIQRGVVVAASFLFAFFVLNVSTAVSVHAVSCGNAGACPGVDCDALGVSRLSEDKASVVICLLKVGDMNAATTTCAAGGGCSWKTSASSGNKMTYLNHIRVNPNTNYALPNSNGKYLLVHSAVQGVGECPRAVGLIQYDTAGTALTNPITVNTFGSYNDSGSGYISENETLVPLAPGASFIRAVDIGSGAVDEAWPHGCAGGWWGWGGTGSWLAVDYFIE